MKKKVAAAVLAAMLLLSACNDAAEEAEETFAPQPSSGSTVSAPKKATALVLACGRNFGKQHPALETEHSKELLPLIYDSLVELDDSYQWVGGLAEEIEQDGLSYTITLKETLLSDGTSVRAVDVITSLEAAMSEGSPWQKQLSIVEEAVVLNARKVRITITENRQDFINLLDFPICDNNNLGSGQYMLDNSDSKQLKLVKNPNYGGTANGPDAIDLMELPNGETLMDSLRIGLITTIFDDLSNGETMNLSEKSQTVDIGHIVFLGVNNEDGMMSQASVRRAVSGALDRKQLCDRVYASKAIPSETPFHPNFYRIADYKTISLTAEQEQAFLEEGGLVKGRDGFYSLPSEDGEGQAVLTLLYNSENPYRLQTAELLKQQLTGIGLQVETVGLPYEDYMAALEDGDFDLYLGELAIDKTMDIRRLFTPGEGYGYGCESGSNVETVYNGYQQGSSSAMLFLSVYQQNMPVIPLLYRQGLIISGETVEEEFLSSPGVAYGAVQQ